MQSQTHKLEFLCQEMRARQAPGSMNSYIVDGASPWTPTPTAENPHPRTSGLASAHPKLLVPTSTSRPIQLPTYKKLSRAATGC